MDVEKINFVSPKCLISFKELLKDFKTSIFILNNHEYIENFLNGLSMDINNKVCINSRVHIQNISNIFDFVSKEWLKSKKKELIFFILKEFITELKGIKIKHQKAFDLVQNYINSNLKPIIENCNYLQMIQIAKCFKIYVEENIESAELLKKISDNLMDATN